MPIEIERKFLVTKPFISLKNDKSLIKINIEQGYFKKFSSNQVLRVRIYNKKYAEMTVKAGFGETRQEKNHPIALPLARNLTEITPLKVYKTRIKIGGWDIDFFNGVLLGIILAEFKAKKTELLPDCLPDWIGTGINVTKTLSNFDLARLSEIIGKTGTDPLSVVSAYIKRGIKRVVFTGPPCSGKTKSIETLKNEFPQIKFIPEVASLIIDSTGLKPGNNPAEQRRFQQYVYKIQRSLESASLDASDDREEMIICDRGTVDSAVYLQGSLSEFKELLKTTKTREYKRYKAVVYFEPPSKEIFESFGKNNPARQEKKYEDVLLVAARTHNIWKDHPNFYTVKNYPTWEQKLDDVRRILYQLIRPVPAQNTK